MLAHVSFFKFFSAHTDNFGPVFVKSQVLFNHNLCTSYVTMVENFSFLIFLLVKHLLSSCLYARLHSENKLYNHIYVMSYFSKITFKFTFS